MLLEIKQRGCAAEWDEHHFFSLQRKLDSHCYGALLRTVYEKQDTELPKKVIWMCYMIHKTSPVLRISCRIPDAGQKLAKQKRGAQVSKALGQS